MGFFKCADLKRPGQMGREVIQVRKPRHLAGRWVRHERKWRTCNSSQRCAFRQKEAPVSPHKGPTVHAIAGGLQQVQARPHRYPAGPG